MPETYPLDALIPGSVKVYASRQDHFDKTGSHAPTYDPDRINCYFDGPVAGLMRLENGKLVPYGEQPTLNIPGPYAPILPLEHSVTIDGRTPPDPWFITSLSVADEIATTLGLSLLKFSQVSKLPQEGHTDTVDAYFVKVAKYYTLNVGDAWKTKAPYGHGSPGRWVLDEKHVRIYWEPDVRVNPKTAPLPYRPLAENERLQALVPTGYVVIRDGGETGGASPEVLTLLHQMSAAIAEIRLMLSLRG